MITPKSTIHILIATAPVDMRQSIDGLCSKVVTQLNHNPQSNYIFIFRNKCADKVKLLTWDKNGFGLYYKRLEKGRFQFPKNTENACFEIDGQQLSWLLAGFDFILMKQYPELNFNAYA